MEEAHPWSRKMTTAQSLAQLRHLYSQMVGGHVKDPAEVARGLLSPAIAALEEADPGFHLDDTQWAKFRKWAKGQEKKAEANGCVAVRYSYVFTPSSIGLFVKVVDCVTKEELDLTGDL
jgi:hypothetical protein